MDDDMEAIEAGTELERQLALYARARLRPDPAATARSRARVMREARFSFEAVRIAAHVAPALAATRRSMRQRMVMPFLAAAVWLGIAVGTISAAQPGGLLYPTRMWIESAALPSAPGARTAADLERLDARIAEAFAAASRGDRAAVAAALDAYGLIADDALAQTAGNAELQALVTAALDRHVAVLTAVAASLADKGNATASDAIALNIERAIQHNAAVVQVIVKNRANEGGANGAGSDGSTGNDPQPRATPAADPTHADGGSAKPDRTPKPERSPQADHTPHN